MALGVLSLLTQALTACGPSSVSVQAPKVDAGSCQSHGQTFPASCCNAAGGGRDFTQPGCSQPEGNTDVQAAANLYKSGVQATKLNLDQADEKIGNSTGIKSEGLSSDAIVGAPGGNEPVVGAGADGTAVLASDMIASGPKKVAGSGGARHAPAAGGMGALGSDATMKPVIDPSLIREEVASNTAGTQYTSGGGGPAKKGSGSDDVWGNKGRSPAAADTKEITLHGSTLPTMLSADPNDYFSRIKADDSLFKKVHDRYYEKAVSWARKDMNARDIPIDPKMIKQ